MMKRGNPNTIGAVPAYPPALKATIAAIAGTRNLDYVPTTAFNHRYVPKA